MKPEIEEELFYVCMAIVLLLFGFYGVVTLIIGVYYAVLCAGTGAGVYAIMVAIAGLAVCGAAAVLFALLWPTDVDTGRN